jgi:hypothetical protein
MEKIMTIDKKIEDYLNECMMDNYYGSEDDYYPDVDCDLMHRMIDFMMNLNTEDLDDNEMEELTSIIDDIADSNLYDEYEDEDYEDEMEESFSAKKIKISPSERRERKMLYKKHRAQLKLKAKKFRMTSKFKQWNKLMKRSKKIGKTPRGKRIRKFL